jgi:hypothetical protein
MKEKGADEIAADLMAAGVADDQAALLSQAAGRSGEEAKQFIDSHQLAVFEISIDVQEALFKLTYGTMVKDVRRLCDKPDCVAAYGSVDWPALDPVIKDILVDLRYRGDYTPASRKRIQSLVAANDVAAFGEDLASQELWSQVPEDRFTRRVNFMQNR